MYVLDAAPPNMCTTYLGVSLYAVVCIISLMRLLPVRGQRTWACLTVSHKKCPFVSFLSFRNNYIPHIHTMNTKPIRSFTQTTTQLFTGSHTTICSKLAQLTLGEGHNDADYQAHSQAGFQACRCLGWRDRQVGVEVKVRSESKLKTILMSNVE